jgi:hypothetical protein
MEGTIKLEALPAPLSEMNSRLVKKLKINLQTNRRMEVYVD